MNFVEPDRLRALPPYLFVDIDRKKRAAIAAGKDVINFGVGDPDRPTHAFIIDALKHAADNPVHHRYPLGQGSDEFRSAVADFFQRRYGVRLDAAGEVLALIGSKEGIGHLPLAVLNPGEVALVPDPGYPVYHSSTIFAGGEPVRMPLSADRQWLPDLAAIPESAYRRARLMFLNYPNNPTGATAPLSFYEEAVALARRHDFHICQDAAYNEFYLGDERPPSILQVAGAKDVAIEMHSHSKTFNMTGWRLGFAVGNKAVLASLAKIKANVDSGVFGAVQDAGIAALNGLMSVDGRDRSEIEQMRRVYRERAAALIPGLRELGFAVEDLKATFYVWARVPAGQDSMTVANRCLDEANVVCIPGLGFGECGRNYVRFALTVEADRCREAISRLKSLKW
jgi:LL-diaminopimelate aminotransferase